MRRAFAAFADSIALGLFGFLLSIPLSQIFFSLGQNGWWVGVIISLIYFFTCQTAFTNGQTIGYRLLGIRVVRVGDSPLDTKAAFIRSLLHVAAWFGSALLIVTAHDMFLSTAASVIYYSYFIAFFTFILFHPLRRGLHDLASGAIVVNKKQFSALSDEERRQFANHAVSLKKPAIISVVLIALLLISGVALYIFNPIKLPTISNLVTLQQKFNELEGVFVHTVQIQTYYAFTSESNVPSKTLIVLASVDRTIFTSPEKLDALSTRLKARIVEFYPEIHEVDGVNITFTSGYSIGIWSFNERVNRTSTVEELLSSALPPAEQF